MWIWACMYIWERTKLRQPYVLCVCDCDNYVLVHSWIEYAGSSNLEKCARHFYETLFFGDISDIERLRSIVVKNVGARIRLPGFQSLYPYS